MQAGSPVPQLYQFGPFQVDLAERLLRRDGAVVPLTPKASETLIALVESRGRLVGKDELMERLWPNTFVEEANLSNQISLLRKALGDDLAEPRYIETVPKRGYRFVADILAVDRNVIAPPSQNRREMSPRTAGRFAVTAGILGILLGATAAAVWLKTRADTPVGAAPLRIARLTTSGQVRQAAISPDGKYVAYVAVESEGQRLWIRHVSSTSQVEVVPAARGNYLGLTFAPDGNFIYYVVREPERPREGALYQVSVLGGSSLPRQMLTDIDTPISLSPDGSRMAYVVSSEITGRSAVMIADADGRGAYALANRSKPDEFSWVGAGPAWVPGGASIITAGVSTDAQGPFRSLIEVQTTDGSQRSLGSRRFSEVGRIGWLADGTGFVVAASERLSENQLWHVSYPGGEARQLTNDQSKNYLGVSLSADSSLLATVQRDPQTSLWLWQKGHAGPRQITGGKYDGRFGLAWTADRRIVYHSMASGNEDIWIMDSDGSNRRQLTVDPGVDERPAVSPDGRHIVFASNRAGEFNLWRVDADGGNEVQLTRGSGDRDPAVTPDGGWVVYSSTSTGRPTLWKVPLAGGQPAQVTDYSSTHPAISPDGKLVAFRYRDDPNTAGTLAILRLSDGARVKVFDTPLEEARGFQWTAEGITYVRTLDGVANVWSQPPGGGPLRQLTDFDSGGVTGYEWSPDGRSLIFARGTMNNDVVLISNVAETITTADQRR